MKKVKTIIALLIFTIVIGCIGCNNSSEKSRFVGKWTVDKAYVHRSADEDKYSGERTKRIDSLLNEKFVGMTYTFSADGKVTQAAGADQRTGTWEMAKDEKNGNAELSVIIMKGEGWEEEWVPGTSSKSLFYMGELDYINAMILPPGKNGSSAIYDLSKSK